MSDKHSDDAEHAAVPKDENGDPIGIVDGQADIYEVDVQLRQSATVAVRADSRDEAWEALRMNHDREVQKALARTQFTGAEYQPEDILAVNNVDEADIDLTGDDGGDA